MNANDGEETQLDNASPGKNDKSNKPKPHLRKAAGVVWKDSSLDDWPENDFRIFCGNLGNEVTTDILANAFRKYKSFNMAKVIREKRNNKTKGYGFVSLSDPQDMLDALKNMNNKFIGNRPIIVKRSKWKDREVDSKKNKDFDSFIQNTYVPSKKFRKFKKTVRSENKEVHDKLINKNAKNY
ncbi:RNA-binding protein, putative [Plasmodium vivax]|uniref:RNA-binding protein, putative n=6 Tax=Plasmodium vivax TaxID=5855 RepID=A5K2K8_PLAVS|nr:RNA-binding protein, putative [Plasmodium vivax]KMZ79676.1 RNA-binding protein [Plasmodium vivax India VII]KMZ85971.1 RNA-binding protein [Plasmodium vivax Brazil I]KMZ92426.1 RNA-binding protein [Plasmodium vivax Mauritania I]KMZ98873.1 RNA-binding protein [Plasmodium vivax North Korean]EDL46658.1 RNA-binding protein, putative [Plasmodium vivax]|eukprot:XP_001616385.1 RNA-binding protein [Plasmodium vivax Sal-1]